MKHNISDIRNYNPSMSYRRFGKTEKQLSVITLGGMRFVHNWDEPDDIVPDDTLMQAVDSITRAMDKGINLIETARGYRRSEKTYGMAFESMKLPRDSYHLMTKGNPGTAEEVRPTVEKQLELLKTDHFDFYAWHGINNEEDFKKACNPGGPVEELLRLKDEGIIGHIGFSGHGRVETICKSINTNMFDFVNLHYYYFFQRNRAAVDLAEIKDMGVFIISPNDKGGQLFNPSPKLASLCEPLSPIQFNARWCLKDPAVHTLSFGMHEPHHFDELSGICPVDWPLPEQDLLIEHRMNEQWLLDPSGGYSGYELQNDPSGMNIPEYLRLLRMYECFDLLDFGRYRYNMYSPDDTWIHGSLAFDKNIEKMDESSLPEQIDVKARLRKAHELFYVPKDEEEKAVEKENEIE